MADIPEKAIEDVVILITRAVTPAAMRALIEKARHDKAPPKEGLTSLTVEQLPAAIAAATARIEAAHLWSQDFEMGRAIVRLDNLYQIAAGVMDTKTALAVERQRQALLRLDGPRRPGPATDGDEAAATLRDAGDRDELLDAIDAHLEPLLPAAGPEATYAERIRQAAEIILARASAPATLGGSKKGRATAARASARATRGGSKKGRATAARASARATRGGSKKGQTRSARSAAKKPKQE